MNGAATTRVGLTGLTTKRIRANYLRVRRDASGSHGTSCPKGTGNGREAFSARPDRLLRGGPWTMTRPSLLAGFFQPEGNQSFPVLRYDISQPQGK